MRANLIVTAFVLGAGLTSCAKKSSKEDSQLAAITQTVTTSSELPICANETLAQVYWVEETGKLVVCNGTQFVEIKGEKGDQGETGEAGEAGSPANSGVWMFDADSKPIGVMMSLGMVLLPNGGVFQVNFNTGVYSAVTVSTFTGEFSTTDTECRYVENDCSGTCYQKSGFLKTLKNAIYRSPSSHFVSTGVEDLVTGITFASKYAGGACVANSDTDGYPITKIYSFPEGMTIPLKTPLSFGLKTEQ